jgi:hypothetical protein
MGSPAAADAIMQVKVRGSGRWWCGGMYAAASDPRPRELHGVFFKSQSDADGAYGGLIAGAGQGSAGRSPRHLS